MARHILPCSLFLTHTRPRPPQLTPSALGDLLRPLLWKPSPTPQRRWALLPSPAALTARTPLGARYPPLPWTAAGRACSLSARDVFRALLCLDPRLSHDRRLVKMYGWRACVDG